MAYTLQPLITILQQILNPQQTHWILDHNKPQLESLLEKAASLQQILEKSPLTKIESLESQIRDAAHKAEDIIESHMVDQMLSTREGASCPFSTPDLQQVAQELDSAMEQVVKLVEGETTSTSTPLSGASFSCSKIVVVGIDADMMQLKDRLIGMQRKLEIVPIVGMGGIGKTTLARKIYEDALIVSHFAYRGWTTISHDYNMRTIVLGLLRCIIGNDIDQHIEKGNNELKEVLYKSLYGRRYLIVLDDMWSTNSWDEIRMYFPDNSNGSRILMTTRQSEVAKHADSQSVQHQMQLLNESASWTLLRQEVFGEGDCLRELQGIGEKIASDCGGLPLAINVIGGILSKVQRSRHVWQNIAKDVRAAIAESDEQFSSILSLSYNHLPNHLKPCFLYFGAFPQDYEIKLSKLVCLWVAEGFVKSNGDKSPEEEAEDYLQALVERNLLLVRRYKRHNGLQLSYAVHDLLRDLCMRKAYEDNFLHVKNSQNVTSPRRVSVHTSYGMDDMYASSKLMSMSLARSFLSTQNEMIPSSFLCALRLVRVLDVMDVRFPEFPIEILQLVNLRFLAVYCDSSIPSGISRLWNLQTLIARTCRSAMPFEIWELSELRHFKLVIGVIWSRDEYVKQIVCKKLQTISLVALTRSLIRRGFFESIPNVKDLGICYGDEFKLIGVDLSHLHKLETLRCRSTFSRSSRRFWSTLKFPFALRILTLERIAIFPRVSTLLCALSNLEVLKIKSCAFKREDLELGAAEDEDLEWEKALSEDEEWEVAEGDEFRSLQFLSLANLRLKRWRADETNFPRLRHLRLFLCGELEEIPSGIGEIATLQLIELEKCSDSVVASARQIQEVQQSVYANYDLKFEYML